MKKALIMAVLCLTAVSVSLYAQKRAKEKEKFFPVKNRTVEFGLAEVHAGFANNTISASQILRKTAVIDLDEFKDGFLFKLDFSASPFSFSFNKNNIWGFGFSTKIEGSGNIEISGEMLSLQHVAEYKPDISGSVFAEAGINGFFTINKFKIKVKPAVYYPVMLVVPDVSYTFTGKNGMPLISMEYNMTVWTAFPYETFTDDFKLTANPGFDFYFGVEYPLARAIGLNEKKKFLDFGLGLDFYNIPLVSSTLKDYMNISGFYGKKDPIEINTDNLSDFNFDEVQDQIITKSNPTTYGTGSKEASRPFKTLLWADWRPLGTELLTIYPSIGFSINSLYLNPFSIEGGIKARLNLANFFMTSVSIGYQDRLWKNGIDFAFNLRAFELDFGVDMRSQDFLKSWTATGLGASFGLKFGW